MASLEAEREKIEKLTLANRRLVTALSSVVYCGECHGKGTTYNPKGRDKTCDCRTRGKAALMRDAF